MNIQEKSIIYPLPDDELIKEKERKWRVNLPDDFKDFIKRYNGGRPEQNSFLCNNHYYAIDRFLCILKNVKENELGWNEIGVVQTQIGERLTDNEEIIGMDVVPVAVLFAGDYLCLDFRNDQLNPLVCVWNHEESGEFDPVMYKTADSFSEFLKLLH